MPSLRANGTEIHYEVQGEGEPVVFLNGILMTAASWALQTSVLERRYRCVLHDFRGQLLSGKPEAAWRLEDHVEDLRVLLDHLGIEHVHLVGTSYGGEVGMMFALAHPERVKSLSVIASVSHLEPVLRLETDLWAEAAGLGPAALYRAMAPRTFSSRFLADHPETVAQGEARLAAYSPEFFLAFARLVGAFQALHITDRLPEIACPTLVVAAEEDALKPVAYSRRIAAAIPGAELVVVPGAGHAVVIEKAEIVNTLLLGFLGKHAGGEDPPAVRSGP